MRAEWERTSGPYHKKRLAEYYGLYRDLFHGATFVPRVPLHVAYAVGEEDLIPVYHGNEVTPAEVMLTIPFRLCVRGHTHHRITRPLSRLSVYVGTHTMASLCLGLTFGYSTFDFLKINIMKVTEIRQREAPCVPVL